MATQELLLSGDVAKNPGPGQEKAANTKNIISSSKTTSAKCDFSERKIRRNQKSILCVNCIGCFHWKCVNWKPMVSDWLCDKCIMAALPFYKCPDAEILNDVTEFTRDAALLSPSDNAHPLRNKTSHFRIMQLETQALASTFNKFLLTVNSFPRLDIVALSETWLRDQPQLPQCVSVPGFTTEFRNGQGFKGGGVGAYIKENIKYKRRRDTENSCPEMEHLRLEIPGPNKYSKALVGVIYNSERILNPSSWLSSHSIVGWHVNPYW